EATGGAERPGRVHLAYHDDAFFAGAKDEEIRKEIVVRDATDRPLRFVIAWSRTEPWKREGRSRSGEASGMVSASANGYHAIGVDVVPGIRKPRGESDVYAFEADGGAAIRVTIRH
ncbi:MAG: hypothetical protein JXP34_28535, partial [Planctomycetes bacterium]|nr:hypothetical protein [Planctomycetota bacterium]